MKKLMFYTLCLFCFPGFGFVLQPGDPILVSDDQVDQNNTPVVQSNSSGIILVVWRDLDLNIRASFSSNQGANWTPANTVASNASASEPPFLAANDQGFLLTWSDNMTDIPYSKFYNTSSQSWGNTIPIPMNTNSTVFGPVLVNWTPQGFLATFPTRNNQGVASLSPDGVTWNTSLLPKPTFQVTSISGCGNRNLLLATFADLTNGNVYVSTSADGKQWSDPILVLQNVVISTGSSGCVANNQGFVIAYLDRSSNIQTISSTDGVSWSVPSLMASNVDKFFLNDPTVLLSGNESGFVGVWVDTEFYGQAAFSANLGQTWDSPVVVTTLFDKFAQFDFFAATVAVSQQRVFFAWTDYSDVPVISISPFPASVASAASRNPSSLNAAVTPRNPGLALNR